MTARIEPRPLPPAALLQAYGRDGVAYADCYCTELPGAVPLASFVEAFYTTPLFKLERAVLRWFAGKPSTDADARALAQGADRFAAWRVEGRTAEQLLLADFTGRTRSWLMVEPLAPSGATSGTRLYFGSAVVPRGARKGGGRGAMGFGFHALLGFHKLYSRLLLRAACAALSRRR